MFVRWLTYCGIYLQFAVAQEDARGRTAVYPRRTGFGGVQFWLFIVDYVEEGIVFRHNITKDHSGTVAVLCSLGIYMEG